MMQVVVCYMIDISCKGCIINMVSQVGCWGEVLVGVYCVIKVVVISLI